MFDTLQGIYVQGQQTSQEIGIASYHFTEDSGPYICYYKAPDMGWKLEDGTYPPEKKPFVHHSFD